MKKTLYNQDTDEAFDEAKIFNGNPNGIMNFNKTNHQFAITIYQNQVKRAWVPAQIDTTTDKGNYKQLDIASARGLDYAIAQLIANDSIQAHQLVDNINTYVTSPIVNACLIKQSDEEVNHSFSYAVIAEDVIEDSDRIYEMYKHCPELAKKNLAVENMYSAVLVGDGELSDINKLLACGANQILEEIVFPVGFAVTLSLASDMPGVSSMIAEIMKDETLSHVPLFKMIYRTALDELYDGIVPGELVVKIHKAITDMVAAELEWGLFMTEGMFGFTELSLIALIETQANNVCKNLKIPALYETHPINPLGNILTKNLKGGGLSSREAFFEVNVAGYSKNNLIMDI